MGIKTLPSNVPGALNCPNSGPYIDVCVGFVCASDLFIVSQLGKQSIKDNRDISYIVSRQSQVYSSQLGVNTLQFGHDKAEWQFVFFSPWYPFLRCQDAVNEMEGAGAPYLVFDTLH